MLSKVSKDKNSKSECKDSCEYLKNEKDDSFTLAVFLVNDKAKNNLLLSTFIFGY